MSDQNRIEELEQLIEYHREAYYNDDPEISDQAFDALEDELRDLHPDSSILANVGAQADTKTKWKKVPHVIPMGSLNKANSLEDMSKWLESSGPALRSQASDLSEEKVLFWSEKMDGISIALQYEKGKLVSAVTRGDGHLGEDIIANVVLMRGVPRHIEPPNPQSKPITGTFRGEIVLTHDWFDVHFEDYSNPRNAASGLARVESREKAKRCEYLSVYVYEAFIDGYNFEDQTEKFIFIDSCDLMTPGHGGPLSMEEIGEVYVAYEDHHRDELFYEIDGLVIRYHDQKVFNRAGDRNRRPHGSVALKFSAEVAPSTLQEVIWQVGNTGRVTPVAVFDLVTLVGAEVQRASLYNVSYIQQLGLNIGDDILVKRANDVIPRVQEVIKKNSEGILDIPTHCPSCSSTLVVDGKYLACESPECPSRVSGTLKAWVASLDLLDWGEFVLNALVEEGLVTTIADLYRLDPDDIANLQNTGGAIVGLKTANKLLDLLHSRTEVTLDQFLGGLNIPICSNSTIKKVMKSGQDTLDQIRTSSVLQISAARGVGEGKASSLVQGLKDREDMIEDLLNYVSIVSNAGPLKGMSFCITGKLDKPRKVIEKMIKDNGGDVKKSVSQSLTYLVCNDKTSTSSKAKKAHKYETPIIGEDELFAMMEKS